jgi:hypothetical protein
MRHPAHAEAAMGRRLLACTIILVCAACGGGAEVRGARLSAEDVVPIAGRTVALGSARIAIDFRMEGLPGFDEPLSFTGTSEADFSRLRRHRSIVDFPLLLLGDRDAGDATQRMEMIADGAILYLNMPFVADALQSPTPWIRMDLDNLPAAATGFQSLGTGQNDPSQILSYLRGATGDFEKVGTPDVRGVATTRYRGNVDMDVAAERAPEEVREGVEASRSQVEASLGTTRLPTEVWIDDEGVVRRVRYLYPLPEGSAEAGEMVFVADLFDFGLEVDVTPPPEGEITDIEDLVPTG